MKYQDGTKPSGSSRPEDFTPERRAWLSEALKSYMMDFAVRMKEIKQVLETPSEVSCGSDEEAARKLEEREELLEELMDIVSSIDHARDLHKIGGLPPLMSLLNCVHPSLRWRAAEVVATCCANNPPVQQWFREGGVLPPLMKLAEDEDAICRCKALLALSALVRHSSPSLKSFREAGGLAIVVRMCKDDDSRVQRKAMALLQYVISRDRLGASTEAASLGVIPLAVKVLESAIIPVEVSGSSKAQGAAEDDVAGDGVGCDQREAALLLLVELSKGVETWRQLKEASELQTALHRILDRHKSLSKEDQEAEQEERELADQLLQILLADQPPKEMDKDNDHVEEPMASKPHIVTKNQTSVNGPHFNNVPSVSASYNLNGSSGALVACTKVDKI